ncbi:ATP-binding protein [Algoriphagus hitonicola]|uniref:AAA+ ATPase domain-containing protein n=1 Tax=Algoriphagus hitonicola TaxID=435880 RepID=A0A1I2U2H5_9BACT|nr:AAA family ATPase [Algoriphagus hitonicola]SFG71342.1 hypothetical protein SAMN04487988_10710 [Algoriphagus hitonicola]
MLPRLAFEKLLKWKDLKNRKPLVIRGARQVGKTTLVREFGKEFDNFIELNLERPENTRLFELENTEKILNAIYLQKNIKIKSGNTLLFIDEIQENPKAIQHLRYFFEDRPDLFVVAAGSLLEFALAKIPNFPVGRVDYLFLHPINFEEYLSALQLENLLDAIKQIPVPDYAHQIIKNHFHDYALIGGMPALLNEYLEKQGVISLHSAYLKLWQAYKDDAEKYARNKTERRIIRHVIETAPFEFDRIKFERFGNSNYRSREVGEALRALDQARVIRIIYPSTSVKLPLSIDFKKRPRLQFLDTGLWNHAIGIQAEMIHVSDLDQIHRGRIIQHLVAQEIESKFLDSQFKTHFWVRQEKDSNSEVDILYPFEKYLIPIEVKSGSSGTLRSLHQFIDRCEHSFAVRFYSGPFKIEQTKTTTKKLFTLINIPYYLATQLDHYLTKYIPA